MILKKLKMNLGVTDTYSIEEEAEESIKTIKAYEEKFGKYAGLFGLGMTLTNVIG